MDNKSEVVNSNEFKPVSYKRKRKKKSSKNSALLPVSPSSIVGCFDKSLIDEIQSELQYSEFMISFKDTFLFVLGDWDSTFRLRKEALPSTNVVNLSENIYNMSLDASSHNVDIICYGLGQFISCIIARYQLGFLLLLKHILKSTISIYDPQFSSEEIQILKDLGLNVIRHNEEGKRTVAEKTIFFMPHCDMPLYNNLLWANWNKNNLSRLMIIGNSFENYEMNDSKGKLKKKAHYIYLANQFVTEMKISNDFQFTDIFNDLAIHYFKSDALIFAPSNVWIKAQEPEYSDDDAIKYVH